MGPCPIEEKKAALAQQVIVSASPLQCVHVQLQDTRCQVRQMNAFYISFSLLIQIKNTGCPSVLLIITPPTFLPTCQCRWQPHKSLIVTESMRSFICISRALSTTSEVNWPFELECVRCHVPPATCVFKDKVHSAARRLHYCVHIL